MAENGRILHHLKNNIEDNRNSVLIVSFMAENTLGRRLKDGEKRVRIFGESYDVRARIEAIDGYSAHADQRELLEWAGALDERGVQQLFVVHSEPEPADTLVRMLRAQGFAQVTAPERSQFYDF
jgi:metallo-beta-lactamase family protein